MKRFKLQYANPLLTVAFLIPCAFASSCSAGPIANIGGVSLTFQQSTLTPNQYVKKNHSAFPDVGSEGDLRFSMVGADDKNSLSLFKSTGTEIAMYSWDFSSSESGEYIAKRYYTSFDGRVYACLSYTKQSVTYYAGFAYGYPEVDTSALNELRSAEPTAITIVKSYYSDGQYQKDTYQVSPSDFSSFPSSFNDCILVDGNKATPWQMPGEEQWNVNIETKTKGLGFTLNGSNRFGTGGNRYYLIDSSLSAWLIRACSNGTLIEPTDA